MRTLKNSGLIHDNDYNKFPSGTIKNETETDEGTPVVRELYGDILTNIYEILRITKVVPNEIEDNQLNGYQLIQGLKKLANNLNDSEQILTLTNGSTWNCPFDLSILPDKYFFFARPTETYNDMIDYSFKGAGIEIFPFSSPTGFSSGSEVLVIIDQATVRAYNLQNTNTQLNEIFTVFGSPLEYLDSKNKIWYKKEGKIFSDLPEIYDLQSAVQEESGTAYIVYEMFQIQNKIVCVCFDESAPAYILYYFNIGDWNNPIPLSTSGFSISQNNGNDRKMHTYFNGDFVYFTNAADSVNQDSEIICGVFDFSNNKINFVANYTMEETFEKTTNAVATDKGIVTLINGDLKFWGYSGGVVDLGKFNSFIGLIFKVKKETYYTNGEIAKKWLIPE